MQVTQIAAYASVSITDTKMQRFFYKSKLNRMSNALYSKSGNGCMIHNAIAALA